MANQIIVIFIHVAFNFPDDFGKIQTITVLCIIPCRDKVEIANDQKRTNVKRTVTGLSQFVYFKKVVLQRYN